MCSWVVYIIYTYGEPCKATKGGQLRPIPGRKLTGSRLAGYVLPEDIQGLLLVVQALLLQGENRERDGVPFHIIWPFPPSLPTPRAYACACVLEGQHSLRLRRARCMRTRTPHLGARAWWPTTRLCVHVCSSGTRGPANRPRRWEVAKCPSPRWASLTGYLVLLHMGAAKQ